MVHTLKYSLFVLTILSPLSLKAAPHKTSPTHKLTQKAQEKEAMRQHNIHQLNDLIHSINRKLPPDHTKLIYTTVIDDRFTIPLVVAEEFDNTHMALIITHKPLDLNHARFNTLIALISRYPLTIIDSAIQDEKFKADIEKAFKNSPSHHHAANKQFQWLSADSTNPSVCSDDTTFQRKKVDIVIAKPLRNLIGQTQK